MGVHKQWYQDGNPFKMIIGNNVTEYYESGEISQYNDTLYYKTCEVKSIENIDEKFNLKVVYFKDGSVKSICIDYNNIVSYHENGEMHYVATYKDAAITGLVVYYDDTGKEYARWEY